MLASFGIRSNIELFMSFLFFRTLRNVQPSVALSTVLFHVNLLFHRTRTSLSKSVPTFILVQLTSVAQVVGVIESFAAGTFCSHIGQCLHASFVSFLTSLPSTWRAWGCTRRLHAHK